MSRLRPRTREAWAGIAVGVLALALIIVMVVVTSGGGPRIVPPSTTTAPPRPAPKPKPAGPQLFAPDSVWNARVDGSDVRLAAGSERQVARLAREARDAEEQRTGPYITYRRFSTPLYIVGPDQPTVRVALDDGRARGRRELQRAFSAVPLPADAKAAPGTDAQLTVYQPSRDRLWEFFRFRREHARPAAGWGGAMEHVSQSPGYFNAESWPGARHTWGATATSLPVVGGTIMISELRRGEIPHALALALPLAREGQWAFPAQRTDGRTAGPLTLPEGAHLRLDPRVNVDNLDLTPVAKMIAVAAQRYGMILRDKTERAPQLYIEDPAQFIAKRGFNPVQRAFAGQFPNQVMNGFPWSRMQVIDAPLCTDLSEPCPPQG